MSIWFNAIFDNHFVAGLNEQPDSLAAELTQMK